MDVGAWIGICVLVPLGIGVVFASRHMKSPRLSLVEAGPGEVDEFTDAAIRFTLLPYRDAVVNSLMWRRGHARITNHRIIVHYRPPFWKEDVVAAIVYRPTSPTPSGDPFVQSYPIFTVDPQQLEVRPGDNGEKRVHIVPDDSASNLPQWLEIETTQPDVYLKALACVSPSDG